MQKYDLYKDSGVQWIGEIPSHWEVCRLKNKANVVLGKMLMSAPPKGQELEYTLEKYLKSKNIGWLETFASSDEVEEMWFSESEKKIYLLQNDDIVMNEGGDIGKVALWKCSNFNCYIQNSVNKITVNSDSDSRYVTYFLFATAKSNYFWSIVSQISIAHLTKEKLQQTPIVSPTLEEQTAIADYLDSKCCKIDNVIATQEKRVELLRELKQSIISCAVTRGINPDAKMKDSGVKWIGEIPEHWTLPRLKFVTSKIGSGSTPKGGSEIYVQEGVTFLRSQNVHNEGLRLNDVAYITYQINEEMQNSQVYTEDVLYNITGASIGRCFYVDSGILPANVNQHVCIVRPKSIHYKFLTFVLQSQFGQAQLKRLLTGGNRDGLTAEAFRDFIVTFPPIAEQQHIAAYIEQQTSRLDSSITKALRQIELLKEYKQSLITEVVTGKRKVC